jgi:hypothetical protein
MVGCLTDHEKLYPDGPGAGVETGLLWNPPESGGGGGGGGGGGSGGGANVIYTNNFETGAGGWTFSPAIGGVSWAVDNTPNGAGYQSTNSLNYNNGINYFATQGGTSLANSGTATSPTHDLTGAANPSLTFYCRFATENNSQGDQNTFDVRFLEIRSNGVLVMSRQYLNPVIPPPPGAAWSTENCTPAAFHPHSVPLDPAWVSIQCIYTFDTVDSLYNTYEGWFIDNYTIKK